MKATLPVDGRRHLTQIEPRVTGRDRFVGSLKRIDTKKMRTEC